MRSTRMAAALSLTAATVFAQQPPPARLPQFSESVEVRVLNLDVDVTDAKGNPVTDLKREDFTLKIGGKPVAIDYFTLVNDGTIHAPDIATAPAERVLEIYKKGEEAYVPRNFLVFVDLGYLPPGLRNYSLNAIRDLAGRLGPNDAMRVVVFNRLPAVLVDWTTSKEVVLTALTDLERQGVGMSRLQMQTQTLAQIDSIGLNRRGVSSRLQLARQYGSEVGMEIENLIQSMQAELVTLTPLSGKKAFLYISGGFEYQPGWVMAQYAGGSITSSGLVNLNVRDVPTRLTAMIQKANADQITFYTVDATGLTAEGTPASEGSPSTNVLAIEQRPNLTFQARQDRQNGMQQMATETGGVALMNTNDFQGGLSRIYQQVSTYYTLGVTLSKLGLTGYQKVDVTVNRPGVTVRARKGFEPLSEAQRVETRARATMETDLSYNAIPAKIELAPATLDKKYYVLPLTVLVPADALTFVPQGDKEVANAEFYIGSVDDKGNASDLSRQTTSFAIPAGKAKAGAMLRYTAQLQTKKGNYRIVVNVRDSSSGRMGTARTNVHVE
ncbi:MAG TPA: VWA domain-containing protein [Thermoanaerobaculia bacterium]|nr:VWA domain-containing protein [Thermoanaerobaculia bacterium]